MMKTTVAEAASCQKHLRDRAAMLVAITTELRPRLSLAERCYFNNLNVLVVQSRQNSAHVASEKHRKNPRSSRMRDFSSAHFTEGESKLTNHLLVGQTNILMFTEMKICDIEAKAKTASLITEPQSVQLAPGILAELGRTRVTRNPTNMSSGPGALHGRA